MRILNYVFEIILSPFTVLMRLNHKSITTNKLVKSILILCISLVTVTILVLFTYRKYIFK